MNRLLSIAALGAAFLSCAAHADPVSLLIPVTYDPKADIPQKVKDECRLDYELQSQISNALVRAFKSANGTTTSTEGQTVRATITYVFGPAGGGWSGPKVVAIRAELLQDGKVQRETKLSRASVFNVGFKGTCAILDKDARTLSKDVVKWIKDPAYSTKEDAEPAQASGDAASASEH